MLDPAGSQQVGAAVRVRVEPRAQPSRGGADQQTTELAPRRRADLLPQGVEELLDGAFQQLQRDVAGEPVRDDDVRGAAQQLARLGVATEVETAAGEELVRLERQLIALLRLLADRE